MEARLRDVMLWCCYGSTLDVNLGEWILARLGCGFGFGFGWEGVWFLLHVILWREGGRRGGEWAGGDFFPCVDVTMCRSVVD